MWITSTCDPVDFNGKKRKEGGEILIKIIFPIKVKNKTTDYDE